jgi:hypothetical protein
MDSFGLMKKCLLRERERRQGGREGARKGASVDEVVL